MTAPHPDALARCDDMTTASASSEVTVHRTDIDGLLVIDLKQVTDERGTVREFFRRSGFTGGELPVVGPWHQVNVTESGRGAIRGLHGEAMTKLVGVTHGEALGAYVDAREQSMTRGRIVTVPLTVGRQVLVPPGVCNGFQSISDGVTQYLYCFDQEWRPGMAGVAVNPLDPELDIAWPVPVDPNDRAQISAKDAALPQLRDVLATQDGRHSGPATPGQLPDGPNRSTRISSAGTPAAISNSPAASANPADPHT